MIAIHKGNFTAIFMCTDHPDYNGADPPQNKCKTCWEQIYARAQKTKTTMIDVHDLTFNVGTAKPQ